MTAQVRPDELIRLLRADLVGSGASPGGITEGPGIDIIGTSIGIGGDSLLLYDDGGSPVAESAKTNAGLTAILAAAGAGDIVSMPAGTIAGNHTVPANVELIGMGLNSVLSGNITNNGVIHLVKLSGTFPNSGVYDLTYDVSNQLRFSSVIVTENNINVWDGGKIRLYSDAGVTKTVDIDGATGYEQLIGLGVGTPAGAANQITIVDGGTIGQAAGPLLTFDDTNNYLEITGCNVGIGTATPTDSIQVYGVVSKNISVTVANDTAANRPALNLEHYGTGGIASPNNARAGVITFRVMLTDNVTIRNVAYIDGFMDGNNGAVQAPGRLGFYVSDGVTAAAEIVRITSGKRVGIGTTHPDARLDLLSTTENQLNLTYTDGATYAGFLLDISGNLTITPTPGNLIKPGVGVSLRSQTYTSDLQGWTIAANGDAEFNNIVARGALKITALQYGFVLATNGSIWVVPASGRLYADCTSVDSPGTFSVDIDDPDGMTHASAGALWTVGDVIRLIEPLTGNLWATISAKVDQVTYWRLTCVKQSPGAGTNYTFRAGLAVLDYGASGKGFVQISADAANSPYVQMGTHAGSPWTTLTGRVRFGNLNGSVDYIAETYGFWAGQYGVASRTCITVDDTNGIRIFNNVTQLGAWDASGNILIGQTGAGQDNVYITAGAISIRNNVTERIGLSAAGILTIKNSGGNAVFTFDAALGAEFTAPLTIGASGGIYQGTGTFAAPTTGLKLWNDTGVGRIGGYNGGNIQWYANTDGKLYAGAGGVIIDATGITFDSTASALWTFSGASIGSILALGPGDNTAVYAIQIEARRPVINGSAVSLIARSNAAANIAQILVENSSGTGKVDFIISAVSPLTVYSNSVKTTQPVYIGDTTNANVTLGLTINQAGNDDNIIDFKSSDVSQPFTSLAEADTYGACLKHHPTAGGLVIRGFRSSADNPGDALVLSGSLGEAADTTKSTAAIGVVSIVAAVTDGGTGRTTVGADGNLMVIRNYTTTRYIFDAEGSAHADVEWTTFARHNDVGLLAMLERTAIARTFGAWAEANKRKLEKLGIARFDEKPGHCMLNYVRLGMLLTGAIRQIAKRQKEDNSVIKKLSDRIEVLENRLNLLPQGV